MDSTCCTACSSGEVEWNEDSLAYKCNNCDLEIPFGLEKDAPLGLMKGKKFIGSSIHKEREESNYWRRLRKLNSAIREKEEWVKNKRHFESSVERNRERVLEYWDELRKPKQDKIERGRIICSMERDLRIPISVAVEVVRSERKSKTISFDVFTYKTLRKYGGGIEKLWSLYGGSDMVKDSDNLGAVKVVKRIADKMGLSPYTVSHVLEDSGAWTGATWANNISKKSEEYGVTIGMLWDNREARVKDDWTMSEVVDEISDSLIGMVSPAYVLQILVMGKRIKKSPLKACEAYYTYRYANAALDVISDEGPQTKKDIAKRFDISTVSSRRSLDALRNRGFIKVHQDRQKLFYYYKPGQEDLLKEIAPYLKLEEDVMNSERDYITQRELQSLGNFGFVTAYKFLREWIREGKLVRVDGTGKTNRLYAIVKDGNPEESVVRALRSRYSGFFETKNGRQTRGYGIGQQDFNYQDFCGMLDEMASRRLISEPGKNRLKEKYR